MLMWMGRYGRQSLVELGDGVTMNDLRNFVHILDEMLKKEQPDS